MRQDNNRFIDEIEIIIGIAVSILVIAIISTIALKFYHYSPDTSAHILRPYEQEHAISLKDYKGENIVDREGKERLCYMLSVISVPLTLILLLYTLRKFLYSNQNRITISALHTKCIVGIFFFMVAAEITWLLVIIANFTYYSSPAKWTLYTSPILPLAASAITVSIFFHNAIYKPHYINYSRIIYTLAVCLLIGYVCHYMVFDEYSINNNSHNAHHQSPIIYPIIQTYFGNAILIDFKSLYGLYPYLLNPVLHIIGLSIFNITLIFMLLQAIILFSIAYCIYYMVHNKWLALIGFITFLYIQFLANDAWPEELIFQYEPIRMIFPALLLSYLIYYLAKPNHLKYYGGLLLFSIGTIWNLDTGIFAFLAFVGTIMYREILLDNTWKLKLNAILIHAIISSLILLTIWGIFFLYIHTFYGKWPNISWITYGQQVAVLYGYAMLPIPILGIWQIPITIYIIGFILSIRYIFRQEISNQNIMICLLTLCGTGLFAYFVGRSHPLNVLHCSYPAIILLIIYIDKLSSSVKNWASFKEQVDNNQLFFYIIPLFCVAYLFSAFFINLLDYVPLRIEEKYNHFNEKPYWVKEAEFVKTLVPTNPGIRDDILIINSNDQDYYFALALKAKSPLNIVNYRHMFYVDEFNDFINYIPNPHNKWIVLIRSLDLNSNFSDSEYLAINKVISEYYIESGDFQGNPTNKVTVYRRK